MEQCESTDWGYNEPRRVRASLRQTREPGGKIHKLPVCTRRHFSTLAVEKFKEAGENINKQYIVIDFALFYIYLLIYRFLYFLFEFSFTFPSFEACSLFYHIHFIVLKLFNSLFNAKLVTSKSLKVKSKVLNEGEDTTLCWEKCNLDLFWPEIRLICAWLLAGDVYVSLERPTQVHLSRRPSRAQALVKNAAAKNSCCVPPESHWCSGLRSQWMFYCFRVTYRKSCNLMIKLLEMNNEIWKSKLMAFRPHHSHIERWKSQNYHTLPPNNVEKLFRQDRGTAC